MVRVVLVLGLLVGVLYFMTKASAIQESGDEAASIPYWAGLIACAFLMIWLLFTGGRR